jgi:hypothetical protein
MFRWFVEGDGDLDGSLEGILERNCEGILDG